MCRGTISPSPAKCIKNFLGSRSMEIQTSFFLIFYLFVYLGATPGTLHGFPLQRLNPRPLQRLNPHPLQCEHRVLDTGRRDGLSLSSEPPLTAPGALAQFTPRAARSRFLPAHPCAAAPVPAEPRWDAALSQGISTLHKRAILDVPSSQRRGCYIRPVPLTHFQVAALPLSCLSKPS